MKQIRVIGLVADTVCAESSLVSQAEIFQAEDRKAQAKEAKRRHLKSASA